MKNLIIGPLYRYCLKFKIEVVNQINKLQKFLKSGLLVINHIDNIKTSHSLIKFEENFDHLGWVHRLMIHRLMMSLDDLQKINIVYFL
jgi:hypothetical protein